MESYGYKPSLQFFHTPPSFSYTYITIYVMLAASPLLALAGLKFLGALLALAGIVSLVLEEELYIPVITRIYGALWGRRSANIVAEVGGGPKTIVLMAHYDSTKAAFSFNPARIHSLRPTIKINFISSVAVASLTLAGLLLDSPLPLIVSSVASIPLIVSSLILVHREIFHDYVPGANDNASGVAVLLGVAESLARDPGKVEGKARVIMVFTGAEEVGLLGSHYFYGRNWDMVRESIIINIDNPGIGGLALTECEGVIMTWCSSRDFREYIREFAMSKNIQTVTYKLLPTDVTPLMRRGLRASSLMAFVDGMIANYHWYTDTADRVSSENLERARSIVLELIEALARDILVRG
ncbi:MAG: M28 family metallopeptidase [Acidilobaceae archaeon]